MATYEAGVFKDKHYDTLLDAQNDPTIEDRMTCFIAGKLYYKFGGVFQEVKMEIHNGIYLDLITVGSPEVPNPIVGVPYLFFDPDAVTYYLMATAGDGSFRPIPFDARFLLKESSILGSLIESNAIATNHIINQNITTEKYAYNSIIGYNHIQNGSIQNEQLAVHSVGANNYSPYSITSGAIGNGEVKNANIATGAVTNSKISDVDASKITGELPISSIDYTFEQSLSAWSDFVSDNTDFTIPALSSGKTRSYVYLEVKNNPDIGNPSDWKYMLITVQGVSMYFMYSNTILADTFTFKVPLVSNESVLVEVSSSENNTYKYRYVRESVFG